MALSADKKYYVNGTSCSSCPSGYPESAGGAINDSSCYTVKTETGTCTNAAVPDGCKTVSAYNSVTPTTCTWKSYKNGSGTKCTPAACTNTVKSVTAKSGYYTSGTSCTKCATGYTSADGNIGTTASGTCYISVAAGKYLTTANGTTTANCANWTYKAAHIVYQGNTSSCTGCPTLTNGWSKKDSSGTSWSAESSCVQIQTPTNCSSGSVKQVASNGAWGATQSDTALSAKNNYYVSGTSCPACSGIQSGAYPSSDGGQIDSTKCYTSVKVTGNCTDEATPAGCASATRTAGTKTECTWKKYSNGSGTACTPTSCTNSISSVSANANHYVLNKTCPACPEDYPYSSGGAISEGKCYTTATESKACTNASTPDGCASATYTTKPASTCQWTNYKDGSGSKCNPTACTNPVATVKAKAGYYAATNATSCTACPNGGTSDAGATAETACYKTCDAKTITGGTASNVQTKQNWNGSSYPVCTYSVNCDAGYGADGNNTASPSCTQCPAGQYSAGKTNTCKNCAAGSYSASKGASSCSACDGATKYQNEAGKTSCKDVSKGYYKSSNSAQSQCPANYQSGAGASTQAACQTSCAAGTRVATANAACTVVDGNNYMAAHTVNYGSVSGTPTACKSGYTITGSTQQDHDDQTDCKITCAAGKYIAVAGAGCVQCPAKSYCAGGTKNQTETLAATGCPAAYPNSDAGATAITLCYSNNRSRAWEGKQNEPTKPDGCASMVTAACSLDACSYSVYSNSTGTADGNHHEGCTTNNAPCTKSITSVTATTGHYVNNKTCPACTNKPANSSYTGAGTTATNCTWACDNNYGKTYDSQCIKICTAGITKLRAGDNVTVQLYDTKHTTPSIVIQNGDKMCYGNLIEGNGKGALNVSYKNTTYHSVN